MPRSPERVVAPPGEMNIKIDSNCSDTSNLDSIKDINLEVFHCEHGVLNNGDLNAEFSTAIKFFYPSTLTSPATPWFA
jgi:hypothetical protein